MKITQNTYRFIRLGLIILCISYISCKKEIYTNESINQDQKKLISNGISISNVSLTKFKNSIDTKKLGKLRTTFDAFTQTSKDIKIQGYTELSGLSILIDSIKEIRTTKQTSWVFPLKLSTPKALSFQNLTISLIKDTVSAHITTYTPSKKWVEQRKRNEIEKWEGEIDVKKINLNSTDLLSTSSQNTNNITSHSDVKPNLVSVVCDFIVVFELVPHVCSDGEFPWECYWYQNNITPTDPGQFNAYYSYEARIITTCYLKNEGGDIGGYNGIEGGNGNGGGYNTTPNVPPGFDPCDQGGGVDVESTTGLKTFVLPPTPCDNTLPGREYPLNPVTIPNISNLDYWENFFLNNPTAINTFLQTGNFTASSNYPSNVSFIIFTYQYELLAEYNYLSKYNQVHNMGWSQYDLVTKAFWHVASDRLHFVLDVAGFFPVFGAIPDIINGGIYFLEGNSAAAGFSLAAAIPIVEYFALGGKVILKSVKVGKRSAKLIQLSDAAGNLFTKIVKRASKNIDASVANQEAIQKMVADGISNPQNPYTNGIVEEFVLDEPAIFVRVINSTSQEKGAFLMNLETFQNLGMSANSIEQSLALFKRPTQMQLVTLPAGTTIRKGIAKDQVLNGVNLPGGGLQFEVLDDIDQSKFIFENGGLLKQ